MRSRDVATIDIDYSRYGCSTRITVPLFGDRVRVVGDDVPDRGAVVAELLDGGRRAVLEFDDSAA